MSSLFEGQWQILQNVAQGAPLSEVLEAIVRLIEAQGHEMLCSILLFDPDNRTLRHGAAPSLPTEYIDAIDGSEIGPTAGSCGAVAYTRQPIIVEDTSTHPNWLPWRDLAQKHRLRSCWSTPIFSPESELLGTFAMYYAEPRRPTDEEQNWVATATHLTAVALALSKRAELETRLRQAQRLEAVGKLAGGVAHDFNNLLAVITTCSAMLAHDVEPGDPKHAELEAIQRAAVRASELTQQLLAIGRQQVLKPRQVDLSAALPALEHTLRRVLGQQITLDVRPTAKHAVVQIDPGQLEQVVMNLVMNARDAMPSGGSLVLGAHDATIGSGVATRPAPVPPGKYVVLTVKDTGHGMDEATQGRIFEPFFTTKEHGKGTGLGLASVWGIVTQSGGYISVRSRVEAGSTFEIYFPSIEPS
jgi:signal transduction histidine kinase